MDLLTHLRAYLAVADEGSFTAGAAGSATPQPVLSRRVAALERALGGPLLERGPRGVTLTPLGAAVLPPARDLLVRADHLLDTARGHVLNDVRAALPPQADPRSLAELRRMLTARGVTVVLDDAEPGAREQLLARGVAQLIVMPVSPDRAQIHVPLGGATVPGTMRSRRLHVEQLRDSDETPGPPQRLLLQVEDDVPHVRDRLTQAAHAAGLAPYQVVTAPPAAEALTAVHERGDVLVCDTEEARRHGLEWRKIVPPIVRGYRVRLAKDHPSRPILDEALPEIVDVLGRALGAPAADRPPPAMAQDAADG
ncbi:LysR family transcriptional regulator [Georgenia halophila]|uniref:LysR family transcriptional regulator n=1 Tax=Georgenia halophila TaxID=620889 RepID=A0ABP8KZD4_9MICO